MLEAVNLTKVFDVGGGRRLWALDGFDLCLKRGETLAVVGESGCGKSTLARVLLRLIAPDGGQARFNAINLQDMKKAEVKAFRRSVQMIFQDPYSSLNPRMRVGDIVGEPLDVHGLAKGQERSRLVESLLDRVGLDQSAARRYPREFSGGQRQRIGIARALAVEPSILVADEPVSALDVSIQAQILTLLGDLQEERGLGVLFISHDLRVVRSISHRIAVMYLGKIVETGQTEDVFLDPCHPYTRLLLESVPVADPRVRSDAGRTRGEPPSPIGKTKGCPFAPRCAEAQLVCSEEIPSLVPRGSHEVRCHFCR